MEGFGTSIGLVLGFPLLKPKSASTLSMYPGMIDMIAQNPKTLKLFKLTTVLHFEALSKLSLKMLQLGAIVSSND